MNYQTSDIIFRTVISMLANKDSSSNKKYTRRGNFLTLFYVSLFGFIFLSGSMLSISPSGLQTQPQAQISLGLQDVDAQQYYPEPQMGYDDRSYGGGGDYYQSNSYDSNRYDSYGSNSYNSYANSYEPPKKSYDDSYDSYDKKERDRKNVAEIEKDDNKLFICPDTGIVVDDRINCPQKCPFNT
ncbi:MAG TPA: hypothetical protein VLA74_11655, partial [Nitrososphaeraceae archaeon]|nr:hypothetical protein [Nitrososphaeraceae archaeon]